MLALHVEQKWNRSEAGAIRQIRAREYPDAIEGFGGEALPVGIYYEKYAGVPARDRALGGKTGSDRRWGRMDMILITGGSYQGKLDYARKRFGLLDADICVGGTDFSRKCLAYIDRYALDCVRRGEEPADAFRADPAAWRDSVIITTDIACGVVPVDPVLRAWREACGRMNSYLAGEADEVWRLFCGIPQRLK